MLLLYIIAPTEGGPCKIGYARNIRKRLSALQIGSFEKLQVFSTWTSQERSAQVCENQIHHRLKRFHMRGEWFDVSVIEAENAATELGMCRPALTPPMDIDAIQEALARGRALNS